MLLGTCLYNFLRNPPFILQCHLWYKWSYVRGMKGHLSWDLRWRETCHKTWDEGTPVMGPEMKGHLSWDLRWRDTCHEDLRWRETCHAGLFLPVFRFYCTSLAFSVLVIDFPPGDVTFPILYLIVCATSTQHLINEEGTYAAWQL